VQKGKAMIVRILKVLLFLVIVGFVALAGYAYFGDLSPNQSEQREPVTLDVN